MKKMYIFSVLCFLALTNTRAATIIISVTNTQFSPANPTVVVGDVIRFSFIDGFHNATSNNVANALPAGAAAINSGAPSGTNPRTYDYLVTKAGNYKYICEVHADASSFSGMVATFTATANLPVLLKDFDVAASTDKKVLVNWSTLTEQNVNYFSVRRSSDGFAFQELAKVSAVGNSTTLQTYNYTDNTLLAKDKYVYYSLAITDKDGKLTYSPVKSFKNPLAITKMLVSVGPNPITRPGQLMVQFNADKAGEMLVKIYNNSGQMIGQHKMSAFVGLNNGHVHICDLAAGNYILQFTMNGLKETQKIIIQ